MRKIASNDELMTTRQAGELLGVAVRTVQLWVESGVLPAWRTAGGHRRIARSAVDQLLSERARVLAPRTAPASAPRTDAPAVDAQVRPLKLLLVEDDPDLLRLFTMMAEGWSYPVELSTASNGFEGLVRIGELRPDMVVTDLNMPGMDGFQMIRSLKKPGSGFDDLNLVVVTAYGSGEIRDRGGIPADVRVFQKPVPFAELEALGRERWQRGLQAQA